MTTRSSYDSQDPQVLVRWTWRLDADTSLHASDDAHGGRQALALRGGASMFPEANLSRFRPMSTLPCRQVSYQATHGTIGSRMNRFTRNTPLPRGRLGMHEVHIQKLQGGFAPTAWTTSRHWPTMTDHRSLSITPVPCTVEPG